MTAARQERIERADQWFETMIYWACLAGESRKTARVEGAPGLLKMADRWSGLAQSCLDDWITDVGASVANEDECAGLSSTQEAARPGGGSRPELNRPAAKLSDGGGEAHLSPAPRTAPGKS